ncbi:MAG: glutamine-hydrolyzing GMP synthase [Candidatus Sericytochromatia bacterium]|nr:glutamine-hydrolyzing GMP synthase [Candidatus Sericytochromatia bacterium]
MSTVAILDFGSQYTRLIARRVRELGLRSVILPHDVPADRIAGSETGAIILSGGPDSVHRPGSLRPAEGVLDLKKPILGICYGMQLLAQTEGGTVEPGERREYGPAVISCVDREGLLAQMEFEEPVWMSHGDHVAVLPAGWRPLARTSAGLLAAAARQDGLRAAVQFHPEVTHTPRGMAMLGNFLFGLAGLRADWNVRDQLPARLEEIRAQVGKDPVLVLVSGGVDSTVVAALLARALPPEQVVAVHVDSGLMRKDESRQVMEALATAGVRRLHLVEAQDRFLQSLSGVSDPEIKRHRIGDLFIQVQEEAVVDLGLGDQRVYLAQGTLHTDLIESGHGTAGAAVTIKTHHNVGSPLVAAKRAAGLIVEPNRDLFKDEVRELGRVLGLPEHLVDRHPFPGPGLAIRILGEVTPERLDLLREVDAVFTDQLRREGLYDKVWQAFPVLLPIRSVGVVGDGRSYDHVVALRAVDSQDGMTAQVHPFAWDALLRISGRIVEEVRGVGRVVYDLSPKPPATIEWE